MTQTGRSVLVSGKTRWSYRRWSKEEKLRMVEETRVPGASVSVVARRHDVNANQLFRWRRELAEKSAAVAAVGLVPVGVVGGIGRGVATVEARPLSSSGRMTIEVRGGYRVQVGRDVDEVALKRVLLVLGSLS